MMKSMKLHGIAHTYNIWQLDLEYIQHLGELTFVRDRMNLVI